MTIVGVNHRIPILHLSKRMVHIYTTGKTIHQFSIGYMINPSPQFNKIFTKKVEKCLGYSFFIRTMKNIKKNLMKKNTFVMAPIVIYENNGEKKVYRVLSCVVYTLIDNYVCIDYLLCQSKTVSDISSNSTFKYTSFNLLLGIGIPELLLNLLYCHRFTKKPNSTVILNFRSRLINNYLSKGFSIIEHNTKQLSLIPNHVKFIINLIDKLKTDYVMVKNEAISTVANTITHIRT